MYQSNWPLMISKGNRNGSLFYCPNCPSLSVMKLQLKFILLIFKLSAAEKSGAAPDSSITIFYCVWSLVSLQFLFPNSASFHSFFIPAFLGIALFCAGRETVKAYGLSCCNHYLCHVKRAFLLFYLLWGITRLLAAFPPRGSPSHPYAIRSARRPMGPAAPDHAVVVRPSAVVRGCYRRFSFVILHKFSRVVHCTF